MSIVCCCCCWLVGWLKFKSVVIVLMIDRIVNNLGLAMAQIGEPVDDVEEEECKWEHDPTDAINVTITRHRLHCTLT